MPKSKLVRRLSSLSLLALFGLVAPACASNTGEAPAKGQEGEQAEAQPEAKEGDQAKQAAPIAGKPVEGEQKVGTAAGAGEGGKEYTLQIDPGEAKVGEPSRVSIRVVPQGEWHMNLEYPTKLEITAPAGTKVDKPKLGKDDAVKLDEEGAEFAVAFTPKEAGDKTFTGEFKFAICQDEACVPKTEALKFQVAVK